MNEAYRWRTLIALAALTGPLRAATLQGFVRDSRGTAVAGATVQVRLIAAEHGEIVQTVQTDSEGHYRILSLAAGSYTVIASMGSLRGSTDRPLLVAENDEKIVDLALKPVTASLEFFDEPKFSVAGVTENTYVGGHGSESVVRSTEALTKAAASLSSQPSEIPASPEITEKSLRDVIARDPVNASANWQLGRLLFTSAKYNEALTYLKKAADLDPKRAGVHHLIAASEERLNNPLEAVREFQRAAELDPSEGNLFDWGTELLIHKAPEPALEVFNSGIQRFPLSSRMLLGAAVACYARGDYSQAASHFFQAADLDPGDPQPYMFLGKQQAPQIMGSDAYLERLARFASLQPQSAWANYYYAVALWHRRKSPEDFETQARVSSLLENAVRLDPGLAPAFFELGVVYLERRDTQGAIQALRKAVEIDPKMEQAHYDLAQAYREAGKVQEAQRETEIFRQLSKNSNEQLARERSELQQFVVALKSPASN